ncbi:MAG: ubiquitin-like small modifier protein 1 [Candidatus Bipolaricaulota bacterium]
MSSSILPMMQVLVKLFAEFREAAGRDKEALELAEGATVGQALEELSKRIPSLAELMFAEGRLRDHLHVFVNGCNVATSGGLEGKLSGGKKVSVSPSESFASRPPEVATLQPLTNT